MRFQILMRCVCAKHPHQYSFLSKKPIMKTKSGIGNRSRKKIRILRSSSSSNHSDVHTGECDRHPFSNSMLWASWPRWWMTCRAWWFAMELCFRVWYCLYRKPDVGKILCTMHESPSLGSPSLPPYTIQYPPPFMIIFLIIFHQLEASCMYSS